MTYHSMSEIEIKERLTSIKNNKDPLVQAQMVVELKKSAQIKNIDIAEFLGVKSSYVSHLIRVTRLPEIVIDGYLSKQITFTHLIVLSRIKETDVIVKMYEEILAKNYTVSTLEQRVRQVLYLVDTVGKYLSAQRLAWISSKMKASLGENAHITIIQSRIKAKILIEYPGDLSTTSQFIELFGSKFRQKKQKTQSQEIQTKDTTVEPEESDSEEMIENEENEMDDSLQSEDNKYLFD